MSSSPAPASAAALAPALRDHLADRAGEFDLIDEDRRGVLRAVAGYLRGHAGDAAVVVICTHNSRRSQLGQSLLRAAAAYHEVPGVRAHSCGSEVTALHPNAAAALSRAGFLVGAVDPPDAVNPRHLVRVGPDDPGAVQFSKTLTHPSVPKAGFLALPVCASADAACPVVPGAAARVFLPYEDPKAADGTARAAPVYDERCRQIARELLWAVWEAAR